MLHALGIAHTKDTPVGDSMLRGVSGGERKQVTLAEMWVQGGARGDEESGAGARSATKVKTGA